MTKTKPKHPKLSLSTKKAHEKNPIKMWSAQFFKNLRAAPEFWPHQLPMLHPRADPRQQVTWADLT
jgi:hypothetical protein